jgi:Cft2 family RNA processing exonuclease
MQVIFVGGASGVGASCLAIELANQWIIVDAGVRVERTADPLPDLSLLEGKDVRAIFVTHAHADHIGALPLVHRAFPAVPIFASRATGLLMEVMLADAVKVMTKRAAEEMELPLYPQQLVASMLNLVRPLPVGEPFTLPMLPGVTIHASRAGHIAGAVSLSFVAPDGTLVVSGDISLTAQRTVQGAAQPPVERCDLLIMESTYGARLHPNRQAEEGRLAQAVAEGLERGGHVLIPCFGLGRGQEILLILQDAQEKGQIPLFPIYVDGLVRRICSTYLLMPEALTPRLQRQIRRGYMPFTGQNVTFVGSDRDRDRLLAGPPACFLSSSGMLTGGPSVKYAAHLASDPRASILITGYQDEESPGKKLLDLVDKKSSTLDLNGQQVEVHCHIARYSLSGHADGQELANFASFLHPRKIALVHGDDEARAALRDMLQGTEVQLPKNGTTLTLEKKRTARKTDTEKVSQLPTLPIAIGEGEELYFDSIEKLWHTIRQIPTMRVVTARELAVVWYGEASEETTQHIMEVLAEDYEQRYFVRQHSLDEAYRVRGQREDNPGDFLSDLPGNILLIQRNLESSKPAFCRALEPVASIRVQFSKGISERTRYPLSAALEIIGSLPSSVETTGIALAEYLDDLTKKARRIRRRLSAHELARQCREDVGYTLSDLCILAGVSPQTLEERLAVAKLLDKYPLLFTQRRSLLEGEGLTLYALAPEWQETLQAPEERSRPDQNWILSVIEQYLGSPPDLYRRSIDPETGNVTLAFHFPTIAQQQYAEALETAAEETGVTISIAPNAHQGELTRVAQALLPQGVTSLGLPSLYPDNDTIQIVYVGKATPAAIAESQARFHERTGWHLQLSESTAPASKTLRISQDLPHADVLPAPVSQHLAVQIAQDMLNGLPDYHRVGAETASMTLVARFYFPSAAQRRYAELLVQLEKETGWHVRIHSSIHQEALKTTALRLLPTGLTSQNTPSLYHDQNTVCLHCKGDTTLEAVREAERKFHEETDWHLELIVPSLMEEQIRRQVPAGEAIAHASALFSVTEDLYRIGTDEVRKTLWLHFHFPEIARDRYAEKLASLQEQTGWRVNLNPDTYRKALIEMAHRLLPPEVSVDGKTIVYQDGHYVRLNCEGHIDAKMREQIQQQFRAETGWSLYLTTSTAESNATDDNLMDKTKALALVRMTLQDADGLQHISIDPAQKAIQLKFKFPDMAQHSYADQFSGLETQTGWKLHIAPEVNEEAMKAEVRAVLPTGKAQIDSIELVPADKNVVVTYHGQIKANILAAAQAIFEEKTGWTLISAQGTE